MAAHKDVRNRKEKRCTDCRTIKPFSDYYFDARSPDGHGYSCIPCRKKKAKTTVEKLAKKNRNIAWMKRNKNKVKAHRTVLHLIKMGILVKSGCFICNSKPAHAHHIDYDFPDKIIWLCAYHHKMAHYV